MYRPPPTRTMTVRLRKLAEYGLSYAAHSRALTSTYVQMTGMGGAVILMYHSVAGPEHSQWIDPANRISPEVFEAHAAFLAQERNVVSMSALVEMLAEGRTPPAGTVAITLDDGYCDNLWVAAPILARYRLPALLYLPTGYIGRVENQWIDRVYAMFKVRTRQVLTTAEGQRFDLSNPQDRDAAYQAMTDTLLVATWPERQAMLADLEAQLAPVSAPPRLTMTWREIRTLRRRYPLFEVGAHTTNHIDLSDKADQLVQAEVAECVADLTRETGTPPRHFSFPYGRFSPAAQAMVREAGFASAVVASQMALVTGQTDAYALGRIEAPAGLTMLRYWTTGVPAHLPSLLARNC